MTDSITVMERARNAIRYSGRDPDDPDYRELILAIGREIAEAEWLAMKGVAAILRRKVSENLFPNPDPGFPPAKGGRTPDRC